MIMCFAGDLPAMDRLGEGSDRIRFGSAGLQHDGVKEKSWDLVGNDLLGGLDGLVADIGME